MDEVRIPITARDIRDMSFEEMDAIITKFEKEKERRRGARAQAYIKELVDVVERIKNDGFDITINGEHFEDDDITISYDVKRVSPR